MAQGIPVVIVDNGTPVIAGNKGVPITIVGGTSDTTAVTNGQTVVVNNSSHTDPVNGTAHVVNGLLADVHLPSNTALIGNGEQTGVAPTGTFTSAVTFTVVNGVITAITLS